ncbi:hypothetical protein NBRC111894_4576 [Sporolactobacillus inulinus]|uniref:Uncharacterized protein n=1 Tax=Sporolactobacillus inulinus TaxID=2078 RepID=A0A4Y1ZIJ9_9BACL|nr:hypothetical protein NBRC111894_4576 [Sporolactobacillus inulinus]
MMNNPAVGDHFCTHESGAERLAIRRNAVLHTPAIGASTT